MKTIEQIALEVAQDFSLPYSTVEFAKAFLTAVDAERGEPVAWINARGDYVEVSRKDTVYGSHTRPLYLASQPAFTEWLPIETAPWDKEVLLTGASGYRKPHDRFFINGYRIRDWHNGEWNDATGTHLSECGWGNPTHWMPIAAIAKEES